MTHPAPAGQGPAGTPPAAPPNGQPPQGGAGSYVWQPAAPQPSVQGTAAPGASGGEAPGTRRMAAADQLQRMFDKYGPERTADILYGENYEYREQLRQRDEQLARRPDVPQGAVVLTDKAVIDEWNAFRALNTPAATVAERLREHERLAAENGRQSTQQWAAKAATALGVGGAAALGELVTDKGLQFEMRDTTVKSADGKTSTVQPMPYLRKATTDQWTPALEYVQQHHAAYAPAITVPVQGTNGKPGSAGAPTPGAQGAPVAGAPGGVAGQPTAGQPGAQGAPAAVVVYGEPPAAAGGGTAPLDPVAAILAANNAAANAPNALRPAAAPPRQ